MNDNYFGSLWSSYIKIPEDSKREIRFQEILNKNKFHDIRSFLENVLLDDPSPIIRIQSGKILLDNLGESFVPQLANIAQTDAMREGYIGLVVLLKDFIEKLNLPYKGMNTEPWVFDKLREIYEEKISS